MLFFLFCASFLTMFVIFLFAIITFIRKNKNVNIRKFMKLLIITLLTFFISTGVLFALFPGKEEATLIPFDEIYLSDNEAGKYIVKAGDNLSYIETYDIFKGDSNYIIHYTYKKLPLSLKLLTGYGCITKLTDNYILVTTSTNIPKLAPVK